MLYFLYFSLFIKRFNKIYIFIYLNNFNYYLKRYISISTDIPFTYLLINESAFINLQFILYDLFSDLFDTIELIKISADFLPISKSGNAIVDNFGL